MSYFCPNCGGHPFPPQNTDKLNRSAKKVELSFALGMGIDTYKCEVCLKTYLIKVLKND